MVNTMARRTDGGVRFRPVGSQRSRTAPVYEEIYESQFKKGEADA